VLDRCSFQFNPITLLRALPNLVLFDISNIKFNIDPKKGPREMWKEGFWRQLLPFSPAAKNLETLYLTNVSFLGGDNRSDEYFIALLKNCPNLLKLSLAGCHIQSAPFTDLFKVSLFFFSFLSNSIFPVVS